MSITLLTMGALSQDALKESQKPLVDALNLAIGNKGAYIIALLALYLYLDLQLAGSIC